VELPVAPAGQRQETCGQRPKRRSAVAPGNVAGARPKITAVEQRLACERLSRNLRSDANDDRLMRRLNQSASWLSEVSYASEDEARQLRLDGYLCLTKMINQSATWLDIGPLDSDHEQLAPECERSRAAQATQLLEESLGPVHQQLGGPLVGGVALHDPRPAVRRSRSC